MALKRISQLAGFQGVPSAGVGGTATLDIPVGPRYKAITLRVKDSNNAAASTIISDMRLNVNGKTQRVFNVNQLDRVNALNGAASYGTYLHDGTDTTVFVAPTSAASPTISGSLLSSNRRDLNTPINAMYSLFKNVTTNETWITVNFTERWRPEGAGQALAWPTGGLKSFQLEVDISTSAGTVTIGGFAEVDKALVTVQGLQAQTDMQMGNIVKWKRTVLPVTGTTVNWTNFPWRSGVLQSLHIWEPSFAANTVTNLQLKADNYEWRNLSYNDMTYLLAQAGMCPSSTSCDLVLDYDDAVEGGGLKLDGIQDLQFNLTLSDGTARNLTVLAEIYGPPE